MEVRSIRDLAVAVRSRRLELGLTQADLARRAGISRKWVYEFEAGKPTAELGVLFRVLDELRLELELRTPAAAPDGGRASTDLDDLLERHRRR